MARSLFVAALSAHLFASQLAAQDGWWLGLGTGVGITGGETGLFVSALAGRRGTGRVALAFEASAARFGPANSRRENYSVGLSSYLYPANDSGFFFDAGFAWAYHRELFDEHDRRSNGVLGKVGLGHHLRLNDAVAARIFLSGGLEGIPDGVFGLWMFGVGIASN